MSLTHQHPNLVRKAESAIGLSAAASLSSPNVALARRARKTDAESWRARRRQAWALQPSLPAPLRPRRRGALLGSSHSLSPDVPARSLVAARGSRSSQRSTRSPEPRESSSVFSRRTVPADLTGVSYFGARLSPGARWLETDGLGRRGHSHGSEPKVPG